MLPRVRANAAADFRRRPFRLVGAPRAMATFARPRAGRAARRARNRSMISRPLPSPRAAAVLLAVATALAPLAARADAAPADTASPDALHGVRPLVGALLTGTVTSANDTTVTNPDGSSAVGSLSGRVQAFAGAEFPVAANGLALRLTLGVQSTRLSSSSGAGERFVRFPLEAVLKYPLNDRTRIGGGVRYAARIRFTGPGGNTSDGLAATPGVLFTLDYRLLPHLLLDARYVYERYERSSDGGSVEGSHFGIGATAIY